jgi:hypothetical protein
MTLKLGPTTVAPLSPELPLSPLLPPSPLSPVDVGLEPLVVPVPVEEVEDTKGLLSVERAAEVRSRVNCRILLGPCWAMVAEVEAEFSAEPWFQAQIQGEDVEVLEESSLHVVPVSPLASAFLP